MFPHFVTPLLLITLIIPTFVVVNSMLFGNISDKYTIHPPGPYHIVVVFYAADGQQKEFPFATDENGKIQLSFNEKVLKKRAAKDEEDKNLHSYIAFFERKEIRDDRSTVKMAVHLRNSANEERLLHPFKMFKYNEAHESELVRTFGNYAHFMADRKYNEYRLHEVFQITFDRLPLLTASHHIPTHGKKSQETDDEEEDEEDEEDDDDEQEEHDDDGHSGNDEKNLKGAKHAKHAKNVDDDEHDDDDDDDDA